MFGYLTAIRYFNTHHLALDKNYKYRYDQVKALYDARDPKFMAFYRKNVINDYDVDDDNNIIFNRVYATAYVSTEIYSGDFSKEINIKMTPTEMENFVDMYYCNEYCDRYPQDEVYDEQHLLEIMDEIIEKADKHLDEWVLEKGKEMIMNGEYD